jgi:hypothetical protein
MQQGDGSLMSGVLLAFYALQNCNFSRKNTVSAGNGMMSEAFNVLTTTTAGSLAFAPSTGLPTSLEARPEDRVESLQEGALLSGAGSAQNQRSVRRFVSCADSNKWFL